MPKRSKIFGNFAEQTTLHGLSQIHSSKGILRRIFWCTSVVIVVGLLTSQLVIRVEEYISFKTTTDISEEHVKSIEFPAVTVCNFNTLFDVTDYDESDAAGVLLRAMSGRSPREGDSSKLEFFNNTYNGSSAYDYVYEKGWHVDNRTLTWCYFEELPCSHEDFSPTITDMGVCWTFKTSTPSVKSGSRGGLSFGVDIKEDEYFYHDGGVNWMTGIRVQVHPAHEIAQVEELGLAISTGKRAFLSVHKKEAKLMPAPWGKCDRDRESLDHFERYTLLNCLEQCWIDDIQESCGCIIWKKMKCSPAQEIQCWAEASKRRAFLTVEYCGCQPACESTEYRATISYVDLFSEGASKAVFDEYGESYEEFTKSVIGIHVFFDGMRVTKRTESETTTFVAFISDLGGQLGFWMGISVLTIFEVVQLFVDLCLGGTSASSNKVMKIGPGEM